MQDSAALVFTKAIQIVLDDSTHRRAAKNNAKAFELVKVATETFVDADMCASEPIVTAGM